MISHSTLLCHDIFVGCNKRASGVDAGCCQAVPHGVLHRPHHCALHERRLLQEEARGGSSTHCGMAQPLSQQGARPRAQGSHSTPQLHSSEVSDGHRARLEEQQGGRGSSSWGWQSAAHRAAQH
eukprot:CAMPEP_0202895804 /NCGR_PEP_ID=MMETSP1392-20130828/4935_1 /ASSEMBLY_ACC=CAM_ASM_000868 /TAXON_ID=225041 /ORGANISM="Chlamydomonas chlamydogama, Strain SAG 11-48b" /LENGTH=123 /DNA_ID=CAMNT_0049580941 /DNA_START=624 /DNA_END=995 /DNA_ORIENTATION=-